MIKMRQGLQNHLVDHKKLSKKKKKKLKIY